MTPQQRQQMSHGYPTPDEIWANEHPKYQREEPGDFVLAQTGSPLLATAAHSLQPKNIMKGLGDWSAHVGDKAISSGFELGPRIGGGTRVMNQAAGATLASLAADPSNLLGTGSKVAIGIGALGGVIKKLAAKPGSNEALLSALKANWTNRQSELQALRAPTIEDSLAGADIWGYGERHMPQAPEGATIIPESSLRNDLTPKDYASEYTPKSRPSDEPYLGKITQKRQLPRIGTGDRAGQYVGAPPGITTPRQFDAFAKKYADRVVSAFRQGAKPGWFYDDAGDVMRELSGGNPQTAENILGSSAIVSAGNRISNERGMSGRAVEQFDMGRGRDGTEPLHAGQYTRQDRLMERVFAHTAKGGKAHDVFQGPKIDEYGAAVSGQGDAKAASALGANDRWEAWSVYGGADPLVSPDKFSAPTDAQHKFLHSMRLRAAEIIARDHPEIGWLAPKEIQELNWAASKSIGERKSVSDLVHTERWGGQNLERNITNQTWDARPGKNSDHFPGMTAEQNAAYNEGVVKILIDQATGHDRLMTGLGSSQQAKAVYGPSVFADDAGTLQVNPGVSSQGIGASPYNKVSPTTAARVRAQEAVRGTVLGRDAIASTMMGPGGKVSAINVRRQLTPEHAKAVQKAIDDAFGPNNYIMVSNTRGGYSITNNTDIPNFSQTFTKKVLPVIESQHNGAISLDRWTNAKHPSGQGGLLYEELPWQDGGKSPVTRNMLNAIDDPNIPAMAGHADSAYTRGVIGNLAAHKEATQKLTGLMPNPKIQLLLNIWANEGMAGVRAAAKKGIVPAIAVGVLGALAQPSDQEAARNHGS